MKNGALHVRVRSAVSRVSPSPSLVYVTIYVYQWDVECYIGISVVSKCYLGLYLIILQPFFGSLKYSCLVASVPVVCIAQLMDLENGCFMIPSPMFDLIVILLGFQFHCSWILFVWILCLFVDLCSLVASPVLCQFQTKQSMLAMQYL